MLNSVFLRLLLLLSLLCAVAGGLAAGYFWHWLHAPQAVSQAPRVFVVQKGQALGRIAAQLHAQNSLQWPTVWRLYAKYFQPETLKAGEYTLQPNASPVSLLSLLQSGDVVSYDITFAEGLALREWRALMAREPKLRQNTVDLTAQQIAEQLGIKQANPEGWFFPDTYRFERGDSDADILRRAYHAMKAELSKQWSKRQPQLPYRSAYEALIMASIIEKETGVPHERPDIAGVFVRRLHKNMRLQTDPTVIYGMGARYTGNITRKDLNTFTPYNTYRIKGLPPTPIASPGRAALAAAVNPAEGNSVYFVAKGDGSHQFSATLEAHNKAVRQYQLKRRADYTSTAQPTSSAGQ